MGADSVLLGLSEFVFYPGQDRVNDVFLPQRRGKGLVLGLQLK